MLKKPMLYIWEPRRFWFNQIGQNSDPYGRKMLARSNVHFQYIYTTSPFKWANQFSNSINHYTRLHTYKWLMIIKIWAWISGYRKKSLAFRLKRDRTKIHSSINERMYRISRAWIYFLLWKNRKRRRRKKHIILRMFISFVFAIKMLTISFNPFLFLFRK